MLQVCIMIHSGSRGLGHQVATDALTSMERAMARDAIQTNDRQLACARINSQVFRPCQLPPSSRHCANQHLWQRMYADVRPLLCPAQEGKNYLAAMSCAANYAWVNRSSMTFLVRQAFQKMFKQQADDLDMHVVYDVSHNIAKVRPATTMHFSLACGGHNTSPCITDSI